MVAIISGRPCSICGGTHEVCLEDVKEVSSNFYVYHCPVKRQPVYFTVEYGQWNLIDTACPKNHVVASLAP